MLLFETVRNRLPSALNEPPTLTALPWLPASSQTRAEPSAGGENPMAVGAEAGSGQAARVSQDRIGRHWLPVLGQPQPGTALRTARENKPTVRTELSALHPVGMLQIRREPPARRRFPHPRPVIGTGSDQLLIVRAEGRIRHPGAMLQRCSGGLAIVGIPQLRRAVVAGGDD